MQYLSTFILSSRSKLQSPLPTHHVAQDNSSFKCQRKCTRSAKDLTRKTQALPVTAALPLVPFLYIAIFFKVFQCLLCDHLLTESSIGCCSALYTINVLEKHVPTIRKKSHDEVSSRKSFF